MSLQSLSFASLNLRIRKRVFDLFFNHQIKKNYCNQFERFITYMIVLNMAGLVLEQIPVIYETREHLFHIFDVVSLAIFSIEYALRLYVAPEDPAFSSAKYPRLAYFKSPFAIIDLVSILPFYLGAFFDADLRVLRALRLLRLFKLFRALAPAVNEFLELNKDKSYRYKIYALVNETPTSGNLHHIFDMFIVTWVILSVLAVIFESVHSINYYLHSEFIILDGIAVAIFSTEYLMRIYSSPEDPKYKGWLLGRLRSAARPTSIIDLLAILPFYLEAVLHHLFDLRFLRVFRLMRLLKLARYSGATQSLFIVIKREWPVMKAAVFIMLLLVMLAACLGYLFEHEAQPDKFENIPQAIYWSVVTLASVGYGDISPITPAGRAITIVLALLGIGIFAIPAAILSSALSDQLRIERESMMTELYTMLEDGVISADEQELIEAEAKRLHLSQGELTRLLEKAKVEMGVDHAPDHHTKVSWDGKSAKASAGEMSLEFLSKHPELAAEQLKITISKLQQIVSVSDRQELRKYIDNPDNVTPLQSGMLQFLLQQDGERGKNKS
jgi:voltage-gated potassium channel